MPAAGLDPSVPVSFNDMGSFLKRRLPVAVIPTPLPDGQSPSVQPTIHNFYFSETSTQDQLSIIDACIHNFYDVPRAMQVFEQLRKSEKGQAVLDVGVYNSLLDAYIGMAMSPSEQKTFWIEEACALYEEMDYSSTSVPPNAHTYASMLRLYQHFNPETGKSHSVSIPSPRDLLKGMVSREIAVSLVVSDRSLQSSEEASQIIQLLSSTAISMNLSTVVRELGLAEKLGSTLPDPLDDVPEARPVMKIKVSM